MTSSYPCMRQRLRVSCPAVDSKISCTFRSSTLQCRAVQEKHNKNKNYFKKNPSILFYIKLFSYLALKTHPSPTELSIDIQTQSQVVHGLVVDARLCMIVTIAGWKENIWTVIQLSTEPFSREEKASSFRETERHGFYKPLLCKSLSINETFLLSLPFFDSSLGRMICFVFSPPSWNLQCTVRMTWAHTGFQFLRGNFEFSEWFGNFRKPFGSRR